MNQPADQRIDPSTKRTNTWRFVQRTLETVPITVLRSKHDFSKKTPGAAEGVDYLLDDHNIKQRILETRALVRDVSIPLDPDILAETADVPEVRNGRETVALARKGSAMVREAIEFGDKVVVMRGAHDAYDIAGALEALNGELGLVIIDAHLDIHSTKSSVSKSPHGMWVKTLLKESGGLDAIMKGIPGLKPENVIYIGIGQPESAEEEFAEELVGKGGTVFTTHDMDMPKIYASVDALQRRVPVWLELDEDGLAEAAASMPGGDVTTREVKNIATRIGSNQHAVGMQPVVGVGVSEFVKPDEGASEAEVAKAEWQAEVVKSVVIRAIGAGFHEDAQDLGVRKQQIENAVSAPNTPAKSTSRIGNIIRATAVAASLAATATGSFFMGRQSTESTGDSARVVASARDGSDPKLKASARLARDEGLSDSSFLPILTPGDWDSQKPVTELISTSDTIPASLQRYQQSLEAGDLDGAALAEREIHTYIQGALIKTSAPEERDAVLKHAFAMIPDQYQQQFLNKTNALQGDDIEQERLRGWMKMWRYL